MPPRHLDEERFPEVLIERDRIVWGGVAPDAIAAIDEPRFRPARTIDWLADEEAVLVLQVDQQVRAYPVQIMTWHEIVNDVVDDRAIAVTYCPLCNSGVAFDREVGGRTLDFGTSGSLYRSALVMYDRQTESLWTHLDGRAVVGDLVGAELDTLSLATVAWADFRDAHADAPVLTRRTGHRRSYGENPYAGYDSADAPLTGWFTEDVDDRFPAFARLVGIGGQSDGDAVAVTTSLVRRAGVVTLEVDGRPVTVWHQPGTASSLDADTIADGDDVGATGVFVAEADGQTLTFRQVTDGFEDDQTGSTWNILGEATEGPLAGTALEPIPHLDTFWFAWSSLRPDTEVVS